MKKTIIFFAPSFYFIIYTYSYPSHRKYFLIFASHQGWICQHEYLVMKNKSIVHILEFEKIIQFLGKNSLWSDKSCLPSFLHRPGQKVKAKIHIIICICNWTLSILTVNPFHFNQLDFLLENRFFIAIWYRFFSIYVDCRSTMENVTSFSGSINSIFCSNICTNPFIISRQSAGTFFTQKMASHHRCRPNLFLLIATKNGFFFWKMNFSEHFSHTTIRSYPQDLKGWLYNNFFLNWYNV